MDRFFISHLLARFLKGKQKKVQLTAGAFLFGISLLNSRGIAFFIIGKRTNPRDFFFVLLFTYTLINLIYYWTVARKSSFDGSGLPEIQAVARSSKQEINEKEKKFTVIPTTDYTEGTQSRFPKTSPKISIQSRQAAHIQDQPPVDHTASVSQQPVSAPGYTKEQLLKINETKARQKEIETYAALPIDNPPANEEPNNEDMDLHNFQFEEPPYQEYAGAEEPDADSVDETYPDNNAQDHLFVFEGEPKEELLDDAREALNFRKPKKRFHDFN